MTLTFLNKRGIVICLAFLLWTACEKAFAFQNGSQFSFIAYSVKIVLALALLAVAALLFYRYASRRGLLKRSDDLQLVAFLPLGNDKVYLIRCKDHVVGLFVGKSGTALLGKWSIEEWNRHKSEPR